MAVEIFGKKHHSSAFVIQIARKIQIDMEKEEPKISPLLYHMQQLAAELESRKGLRLKCHAIRRA
jgi:hypothetical protein